MAGKVDQMRHDRRSTAAVPIMGRGGGRALALLRVGVLAMQGAFADHATVIRRLGAEAVLVRLPRDLDGLNALILPGGESTTIGKLMGLYGLLDPIRRAAESGLPLLGTCAGAILMAREIIGHTQPHLGLMDIGVRRNAFGRQVDSFETDLTVAGLEGEPLHAIFIRAPIIETIGAGVQVLASLPDGTVVAARERNLLATSFHPELTEDPRFHEYFLRMAGR